MFKKKFFKIFIFLLVFLSSLALANALCCDLGCYPEANRCCGPIGSQIGYIGCESSTHDFFCPGEVLGECLVCQCTTSIDCAWNPNDANCLLGEFCNVTYVGNLPQTSKCDISPCTLTSASWSTNTANQGEIVQLNLFTSYCNGKQVTFTVTEGGLISQGPAAAQPSPATITIVDNKTTTAWEAEWVRDAFDLVHWNSDPEYYFTATVEIKSINSDLLSVEKVKELCGNGRVDIGETCDGTNFGPITGCTDLGFTGGTLRCYEPGTEYECHFNTNDCTDGEGLCGDGITNMGEECDGISWGNIESCKDLDKFTGGNLICDYDTCFFDTFGCTKEVTVCGNNFINLGETCDGNDPATRDWGKIKDCIDFGFRGGTLKCYESGTANECLFDTSACTDSLGVCGDGIITIGETCEGDNLNNKDCMDFGFTTGKLNCYDPGTAHECHFDTTDCSRKLAVCGNDIREGKEECDGFDDKACPYQCTPPREEDECNCPKCSIYWDCSQTRWSECDPETMLRTRIGNCTKTQQQVPEECEDYEPPNEKTCIPEKEFPFFTNLNIFLVILILVGYYLYKKIKK